MEAAMDANICKIVVLQQWNVDFNEEI